MPVLFLSHAGVDTDAARELKRRLEESPAGREAGLRVWFDKTGFVPASAGWQEQLERDPLHDVSALQTLIDVILGRQDKSPPKLLNEPYVGLRSMGEQEANRLFGRMPLPD